MDNERVQPIYFEESNVSNTFSDRPFDYNESDTDDDNLVNVNEVTLKIGDLFNDWGLVQIAIDSYAKQNGFVANKYRKDVDPIDKSII